MKSDLLICHFQSSALKMAATGASETKASITPYDATSEKTLTVLCKGETRNENKYYKNKSRESYVKQPFGEHRDILHRLGQRVLPMQEARKTT